MYKNGIVVVGPAFVDIKGYPYATYVPNEKNKGDVKTVHGGVSRNIAENLGNMHLRPTFLSLIDDSGTGQEVLNHLSKCKVNTEYIKEIPDGMGIWLAIFGNNGDLVSAISKRPDFRPIIDVINTCGGDIFENCDSISLEIDLGKDIVKKVLEYAKRYNKKVFANISNISVAMNGREFFKEVECVVCNLEEAEIIFSDNYENKTPEEMKAILLSNISSAHIKNMAVTMGSQGAVYATSAGQCGFVPALKVNIKDTAGAGDAFFSGVIAGMTYGLDLGKACEIGTRLAASVILSSENVCPKFMPEEFGLKLDIGDGLYTKEHVSER